MAMAKTIKKLLIDRDMSITELANKLNIHRVSMHYRLRVDNFSEKELQQIAEILNCTFKGTFIKNDTGEEI
jgi:Regulator of polyketide synthase expression